jgi:hypothetical protein
MAPFAVGLVRQSIGGSHRVFDQLRLTRREGDQGELIAPGAHLIGNSFAGCAID